MSVASNDGETVRLTLGTAQWGMPYGVANRAGRPAYSTIVRMVDLAYQSGVRCLDTAAAYGESEALLGRALADLQLTDRVRVVTKTLPLSPEQHQNPQLAERSLRASVEQSRARLGLERLPLVLLHREADAVYADALAPLVEQGVVGAIGVSCGHDPRTAVGLARDARFAALQAPLNLLDRRHLDGGTISAAQRGGKRLFARSVFLQGLLLLPADQTPPHLKDWLPWRTQLVELARQAGRTLAEMALGYVIGLPGVTDVVVGVETVDQVRENLRCFGLGPLPVELLEEIRRMAPDPPARLISPVLWRSS